MPYGYNPGDFAKLDEATKKSVMGGDYVAPPSASNNYGYTDDAFNALSVEDRRKLMGIAEPASPTTPTSPTTGIKYANDTLAGLGIVTPQSADYQKAERQRIAEDLEAARKARAAQAESIFGQRLASAERISAGEAQGVKGISGQSAGFNMSTANQALLNNVYKKLDDTKGQIEKDKQAYIDEGNWQAVQRADERLSKLDDQRMNILLKQAEMAVNYDTQQFNRDVTALETQQKIAKGQEFTLGDKTYVGMAEPSIETQAFQNKNTGDVTIVDKNTGSVISTIPGIVGQDVEFQSFGGKVYMKQGDKLVPTGISDIKPRTGGESGIGGDYNTIKTALDSSKGQDGFVNTDVYKQLRNSAKDKTSFDKNFSYMLNPNDASAKSLIGKSETTKATWGQINPTTGKTPEQGLKELGVDQSAIDAAISAGLNPEDLM